MGEMFDYEKRAKWAVESLAEELEKILEGFDESEQSTIREKMGNYTLGYLGLTYRLKY